MKQMRFISQDEADAAAYWESREWKKWAVDVTAGPMRRPRFRATIYVRARDRRAAVETAKRSMPAPPKAGRFLARLAGPRELGCVADVRADHEQ